MAKNHKHLKRLKSERAKVKFKTKKSVDQLPKGLNVTDTSFKVKKISIREQLKQRDETDILSTRKLNIKDLLTRLHHHNSTVRAEALKQLKEIILQCPPQILYSQLSLLLRGIASLSLDKEKDIRRDSFNALNLILGPIPNDQLTPFRKILISYLSCAMTHINPRIKEDSLHFLDALVQNCNDIIAKDSHEILPNFLGMISRLHGEIKPARQLTTALNFKSTSVKWRIKVLERLANMLSSVVSYKKAGLAMRSEAVAKTVVEAKRYVPVYRSRPVGVCKIDFDKDPSWMMNCVEDASLSVEEFVKYVGILTPLMFDIWLEVCPDEKLDNYTEMTISNEASMLLKSIIEIVQSIIEYMDTLDRDYDHRAERIKRWFKDKFHNSYIKNFLSKFPYGKVKQLSNSVNGKRQRDFSHEEFIGSCLQQNLGLCRIHVSFTCLIGRDKQLPKPVKDRCISIVKYLNDTIENYDCINDSLVLAQLTALLKTLFLKASPVWRTNRIDLSHTLELIVETSSRLPREELQRHLSLIIGDVMLECNLNELHREKAFEKFVKTLPSLLLRSSIDDVMIRMIDRIVLRFNGWIRKELLAKHKAIIENSKKINIIGSHDEKQSRLIICNLFYFTDAQVYY